jgi:hypothetical protein
VKAFKAAFESTIVPAYQSGTEAMFQQIQHTFETGMQAMVEENKAFLSRSAVESGALRREVFPCSSLGLSHSLSHSLQVDQLRGTVVELQAQIQELFQQQQESFERQLSDLASPNIHSRSPPTYITLFEEVSPPLYPLCSPCSSS